MSKVYTVNMTELEFFDKLERGGKPLPQTSKEQSRYNNIKRVYDSVFFEYHMGKNLEDESKLKELEAFMIALHRAMDLAEKQIKE